MDSSIFQQMIEIGSTHWWWLGRRNIIEKQIQAYFPQKLGQLKILDVGCGAGSEFPMLKRYGEIEGIENDWECNQYASKILKKTIHQAKLPDQFPFFSSDQEKFDLILLLDVLEHIDDDLRTLNLLTQHLTAQGKIFVTVPAYQFLWTKIDELLHHKRRYNKSMIRLLAERGDFQIRNLTYINCFNFPSALVSKFYYKFFNKNPHADYLNPPHPVVNFLLATFYYLEAYFIRYVSLPFGLSLLIIIEKRES